MKSIDILAEDETTNKIQKKKWDCFCVVVSPQLSKLSNDELCGRGILGPSWGSLLKSFVQKNADEPHMVTHPSSHLPFLPASGPALQIGNDAVIVLRAHSRPVADADVWPPRWRSGCLPHHPSTNL